MKKIKVSIALKTSDQNPFKRKRINIHFVQEKPHEKINDKHYLFLTFDPQL